VVSGVERLEQYELGIHRDFGQYRIGSITFGLVLSPPNTGRQPWNVTWKMPARAMVLEQLRPFDFKTFERADIEPYLIPRRLFDNRE
jgi:hypothetical protein